MKGKQDRKWKLEQLLYKQKLKQNKEYGVLFEECINALGEGTAILSVEKGEEAYNCLQKSYPFTPWSRIDWENVSSKKIVGNIVELKTVLFEKYQQVNEEDVFILWSYGDFPVLQTQLLKALDALEDVMAVSPDVFILSLSKYVIELHHEGEITIGNQD